MEEYFKLLRSGAAAATFQGLARAGLVEHISPEMEEGLSAEFFESLERLDHFRKGFADAPARLTTTILVGSLLVPLGLMDPAHRRYGISEQWYPALGRLPSRARTWSGSSRCWRCCPGCATSTRHRAPSTR